MGAASWRHGEDKSLETGGRRQRAERQFRAHMIPEIMTCRRKHEARFPAPSQLRLEGSSASNSSLRQEKPSWTGDASGEEARTTLPHESRAWLLAAREGTHSVALCLLRKPARNCSTEMSDRPRRDLASSRVLLAMRARASLTATCSLARVAAGTEGVKRKETGRNSQKISTQPRIGGGKRLEALSLELRTRRAWAVAPVQAIRDRTLFGVAWEANRTSFGDLRELIDLLHENRVVLERNSCNLC